VKCADTNENNERDRPPKVTIGAVECLLIAHFVTEPRNRNFALKSLPPDRAAALDAVASRTRGDAAVNEPAELVHHVSGIFQSTVCLVINVRGPWQIIANATVETPPPADDALATLLHHMPDVTATLGVASTGSGNWTVIRPEGRVPTRAALLIAGDWRLSAGSLASLAARIHWPIPRRSSDRAEHRRSAGRLARRLTRLSGLQPVCDEVVSQMTRGVDARFGALAIAKEGEQQLVISATYGYSPLLVQHICIEPGSGIIGQVYQSGKPMYIGDSRESMRLSHRLRYETDLFIAVPLRSRGQVVAVMCGADPLDRRPFTARDVSFLQALSAPAALALDLERAVARADASAEAAAIDPTSGLFNRRYFQIRIEEELQRSRRHQIPVTLLMADLDDFKLINDSYGHLAGDAVIRDTAEILRRSVRVFDVCTRFGGEEFAVIMPGNGAEGAIRIAERIRDQIAGYRSDDPQLSGMSITVSIGMAVSDSNTSAREFIVKADEALYQAKRAGKNRVCLAGTSAD
jgi:diguanylate cyclase (GGDEF)-like protein